ncbi:anti-sigma factor RsiW [Humitalea rosea]|uniref:Anti-sigma factor RsiW n=1 Tax=Humitalea rosea TaxID=990373 RepID=A0A2W7J973_9PROT|nr:anti-sigma factor [Humitalea rosea]PZW48416.1 anti-sigma factor RsiW [Humitalea rosea]
MSPAPHTPGWARMLHGFVDGELDAAHVLECEAHLAICPECADSVAHLRAMRAMLQAAEPGFTAPLALRARVLADLAQDRRRPLPGLLRRLWNWSPVPLAAGLAACLMLLLAQPRGPDLADELVAGHVRSLLARHLTDIETSAAHTVKPWFIGRIDFAPPVVDLAARGFPLVGGRLDYIGGRAVAVLVYGRREHVINLFVWPELHGQEGAAAREGYSLTQWTQAGLAFWAVSDLNAVELREFREEFSAATPR